MNITQALTRTANPDESYDYIKDYINYLKTIGYIVPEFDVIKIKQYAKKLNKKTFDYIQ